MFINKVIYVPVYANVTSAPIGFGTILCIFIIIGSIYWLNKKKKLSKYLKIIKNIPDKIFKK